MQNLLQPMIKDKDVKSMYSNLRSIAGRKGYDVTRTSGTGGYTTPHTYKKILFVLGEHDSLLPKKAEACPVIPHEKYYFILYSNMIRV